MNDNLMNRIVGPPQWRLMRRAVSAMETSNALAQRALIGWIANAEFALKVLVDAELQSGEVTQTTATKDDRKIKTNDL